MLRRLTNSLDDLLTVEFLRFVSSNTFIEVAVRTCGIARVGLYLRDNLKKINDERQRYSSHFISNTNANFYSQTYQTTQVHTRTNDPSRRAPRGAGTP